MNWKKKFYMPVLSAGLAFSAFAPSIIGHGALPAPAHKVLAKETAPLDLAIANDDRLIEMLKKNGKISKDATAAEADQALQQYLHTLAAESGNQKHEADSFEKKRAELTAQVKDSMNSNGLYQGKGNKLGEAKQNTVASVQKETWNGTERKDQVLVLLIDYPDLPHGKLTSDETDMYYGGSDASSVQHYQDMVFGNDGYIGPDGQKKISMKQFYEQQSGGSYTVDGQIAGWYTAKNPAAYYGNNTNGTTKALIKEALAAAAKDNKVDLKKFDKEDIYDLDGDGNTREPDGIIDHLMVVHSGVGEEAGGGRLGEDAIWSHRSTLGNPSVIPGTSTAVPYWGGSMVGYDYTVEPEDGAAGVFSHEFGHDLGYPDEYDTAYTSATSEPVSYWSIMSSGSWTGKIPGTEPSGFSPNAKAFYQESMKTATWTPNWLTGTQINVSDVTSKGTEVLLDEASTKGTNNDAVRINLPDKVNVINTPKTGSYEYHGGKGDEQDHKMVATVDLTTATSASLDFDAWYNIEEDWDYAMVQVSTDNGASWKSLSSDKTTDTLDKDGYPAIKANLPGYTGSSNGWVHQTLDLSAYKGKKIQLQFRYMTDWGTSLEGFFVDNVKVTADGKEVLADGAEGNPSFALTGFAKHTGKYTTPHHYLLEWRSHNGSDSGLGHVNGKGTMISFNEGLVIWYVDDAYDNNWTGAHPGDGFLGIVDADQHNNYWHYKDWNDPNGLYDVNKLLGNNKYQMHDAAFSLNKDSDLTVGDKSFYIKDNFTQNNAQFDDSQDYSNPQASSVGRNVPKYGLKVRVVGQSADGTVGKIVIFK